MATAGERAKEIVHAEAKDEAIVLEMAGNNRYIAVTKDTVYIGSIGISSGSFFGKKVKRYPVDSITSVDVSQGLMVTCLEIVMAGAVEVRLNQNSLSKANNENVIAFPNTKYEQVQLVAKMILEMKQERKKEALSLTQSNERASIPQQINP